MGRAERKRYENNDRVSELVRESETRELTSEEIGEIRAKYTGIGGLVSSDWAAGQFFTPSVVTRFVVDLVGIRPGDMVLEPSCGGGSFLSALPEGALPLGIEWRHETARVARLLHPTATIHQGDALEMKADTDGKFDIVVGNPPFVDVPRNADYKGFEFTRFSRRAEWMFIEMALDALKPGGIMAMIVPDGILGNSKDQPLRKYMLEHYYLRGVISLPAETFRPVGTSCKTSVLIVQKPVGEIDTSDYNIFMAVVKDIGWDSRNRPTNRTDLPAVLAEWRTMYPNGLREGQPATDMPPEAAELPVRHDELQVPAPPARRTKKECPQMAFDFGM